MSLSEISKALSLPKSSTSMILRTFVRRGYLQKNPYTGIYHFGLKLLTISRSALEKLELSGDVKPFLLFLMQKTGLTVHMAVLEDNEAVIVEKIDVPGPNRITTTCVGQRVSAHCTGIGKALLALLSDEQLDQALQGRALWRYNQKTICSLQELKTQFSGIRRRGYSLSDEESQLGFRGIGAPILDRSGNVIAAISVDGRTSEIPLSQVPHLGSIMRRTAKAISLHVGHDEFPSRPVST